MAGYAQSKRYTPMAQCPKDQQEEIIGFNWRGPVH
jgi:hypothetical protein